MNNHTQTIIAKRYAIAFLNIYGYNTVLAQIEAYYALNQYLENHSRIIFFLCLPGLDKEIQERGLRSLSERFGLHNTINNLIKIVCAAGRGCYIKKIIHEIIVETEKRANQEKFILTTSHVLSDDKKADITAFLTHQTGHKIILETIIDKSLIAGIRIKSNTHFWEHSIAKKIACIQ